MDHESRERGACWLADEWELAGGEIDYKDLRWLIRVLAHVPERSLSALMEAAIAGGKTDSLWFVRKCVDAYLII